MMKTVHYWLYVLSWLSQWTTYLVACSDIWYQTLLPPSHIVDKWMESQFTYFNAPNCARQKPSTLVYMMQIQQDCLCTFISKLCLGSWGLQSTRSMSGHVQDQECMWCLGTCGAPMYSGPKNCCNVCHFSLVELIAPWKQTPKSVKNFQNVYQYPL